MTKTALIFGAGKTGRGFATHLAFLSGYEIILVDKNQQLISDLKQAGQFDIQVLGNEQMNCTIDLSGVFDISDVSWHDYFITTGLVFTAVFGNNLDELARHLAKALARRYLKNPQQVLTIITCENFTNAAGFLKTMVVKHLGEEKAKWISESVGFSESIIFRTCIEAGNDQSPLTVRAQNFFELPCDGDALIEKPEVYGLNPLRNFGNQLRRKIYTYNCINAVITYLGAIKGYSQLFEAGNDEEILAIARIAARETSNAQIAEFGFDSKEQNEWMTAAFSKFADKNMPDPIERNGADPERKLGREDRLIGPALLALKHGIYPEGLLAGILAGFEYKDLNKNHSIAELIREKGIEFVLKGVCGLTEEEELFMIIKAQIIKSNMDNER